MTATKALALLSNSTDSLAQSTADNRGTPTRQAKSRFHGSSMLGHKRKPSQPALVDKPTKTRDASRWLPERLFRRTWLLPLTLILATLQLYALNPTESNTVHPLLFLSYRLDDQDSHYGKGPLDLAFVCSCTVLLTFTREFVMHEILRPLARAGGIASRRKRTRFTEQMYTACYLAVAAPLGLYTMKQTPGLWYFETGAAAMHAGHPHTTHSALFKFYYLLQAGFWVQQVVVMLLGQEKPRRDFWALVAHHAITVGLILLSWRFHLTYLGLAVFITHDVSDFFLAISKSLNYLAHPAQSTTFFLTIASWIYLRHYLNLHILYSAATAYMYRTAAVALSELDWEEKRCQAALAGGIVLLAALQGLNVFWLGCLLRGAWRFVVVGVVRDDRSEVEDEGAEGSEERE